MKRFFLYFLSAATVHAASGCGDSTTGPATSGPKRVIEKEQKIIIVDEVGKEWDITHAVRVYGLKATNFQFGLGKNAIPPVLHPTLLSPGEEGYPGDNDQRLVLGTNFSGEARAYAISKLVNHEVVDEQFGETHVAVAY